MRTQKQRLPSAADPLLSRDEFKKEVFRRSGGQCVFCAMPAVDPHHILERKLFNDGGYYLSNGASVCADHHWQCETTVLSVEAVRTAAGISAPMLPQGFSPDLVYDKWGNIVRPDGLLEPGALFGDTGARKALSAGGKLGLFVPPGT
jgi:hypothetical protein